MSLIDRAAAWNPVPDHRPCRVWLPSDRPTDGGPESPPARRLGPCVLALSEADAHQLPSRLPRLLAKADVQTGDRVTVDLASAGSVHLTGLGLLLAVLWRRVGPSGDVTVVGGTQGLHAQLSSLGMTSAAARAAVYGPDAAAPARPAPLRPPSSRTSASTLAVPVPRQPLPGQRPRLRWEGTAAGRST